MTANPIELIGGLTTTANVPKADMVAWAKARVAQVLASVTELRNTNLAGQLAAYLITTQRIYFQDTADTTTADDGINCIVSLDGKRFKPPPSPGGGGLVAVAADVTALKAADTTLYNVAELKAAGRVGLFVWSLGDYSAGVAADTNNGVYVKATAIAATVGAWVRQFDFQHYKSKWFGTIADYATDNSAIINSIIAVTDIVNTIATAGKQAAAYVEIEGGVKFASSSLNYLSSAQHVFVNLRYFANSDTTRGVANGGGGTNEHIELSVNSGYPGDVSGGLVAERHFEAPLHPAMILNVAKQQGGADAHLGTGQARLPTSSTPARASYNLFDENVIRWRAVYEGYGNSNVATQVSLQPFNETVDLANVGSTGWPTIPANGTVVTGVTSAAKGVKVNHSGAALNLQWIAGTFIPGEQVTDGVTTSANSISGGGVSYTSVSYPSLAFGINAPVVSYGEFVGNLVTAFGIYGRLTIGPTNAAVSAARKETVTNASILLTNQSGVVPTTGRQVVLDSSNRFVTVNGVANGTGSTGNGLVGGMAAVCQFANAGGVSTNAFNIASVTHGATGVYAVVFTNALANANFSVSAMSSSASDNLTVTGKSTSGFTINSFNSSAVATNLVGTIDVGVLGGQ